MNVKDVLQALIYATDEKEYQEEKIRRGTPYYYDDFKEAQEKYRAALKLAREALR